MKFWTQINQSEDYQESNEWDKRPSWQEGQKTNVSDLKVLNVDSTYPTLDIDESQVKIDSNTTKDIKGKISL